MLRVILFLIANVPLVVVSQKFFPAPFLAMGNAGTAQEGLYSLSTNPAGIHSVKNTSVAVAYQQHYLGADIQSIAAYAATPIATNSYIGINAQSYGIPELTKLNRLGLVYTKLIGGVIASSIALNHHRYYIQDYVDDNNFSLDLGLQWLVNEEIRLGVVYKNVNKSHFKEYVERSISQDLSLGAYYKMSTALALSFDYTWDVLWSLSILHGGFEYSLSDMFFVRGGVSTAPIQYSAGIGVSFGQFKLDVASSFHPHLGSSPQMALLYAFR